jgi:TetR/AcrR family transcriptional regulator, cholesterol catabolism regulator
VSRGGPEDWGRMTKIHSQEQLLDAAAKVFGEKGYDAARLEDIAAEVGVLQGSLYYHIGSKAGLYRLVRQRRFVEIASRIDEISRSSASPQEKLRSAMHAHLAYLERFLPEARHWAMNPAETRKTRTAREAREDQQMTSALRASWRRIIEDGIEAGEIRNYVSPSVVVLSIQGMMMWVANWYEPGGPHTIEEIADQQADLVWSGLTAP